MPQLLKRDAAARLRKAYLTATGNSTSGQITLTLRPPTILAPARVNVHDKLVAVGID